MIVHNDPYRGGMHTPEHTFMKPVFYEGMRVPPVKIKERGEDVVEV